MMCGNYSGKFKRLGIYVIIYMQRGRTIDLTDLTGKHFPIRTAIIQPSLYSPTFLDVADLPHFGTIFGLSKKYTFSTNHHSLVDFKHLVLQHVL